MARSLYFTHEPSYTLVPLSRYLGDADVEAAQARLSRSLLCSDLRSVELYFIGSVDANSLQGGQARTRERGELASHQTLDDSSEEKEF